MPSGRLRVGRFVIGLLLVLLVAYSVWGWIESNGLSRDIAQIKQRGEPIAVDEWQTPPRTEEQRQAAQLYLAAVERMQELARDEGFRFSGVDVDRVGPAAPDLKELEATYRKDAPALQLLDQATPLDFGGFGSIAPEFIDNQSPLDTLGSLNALRADLLSRRGRGDEAASVLLGCVRLLRTMPISFYQFQAESRLLASLRILLRHSAPTEASLLTLQRAFEQVPDEDGLPREIMLRRALFLQRLENQGRTVAVAVIVGALGPAAARFARRQLAAYDETIAVARQPWPGKIDAAEALARRYPDPSTWRNRGWVRDLIEHGTPSLAVMSLSGTTAGLNLASRRVAITVLALERYRRAHAGTPPPALDALVPAFMAAVPQDPFSGSPLVYKTDPDSYIIYSVDLNRIDDGGVLYGMGAMATTGSRGTKSARDYGIRVPLHPLATIVQTK